MRIAFLCWGNICRSAMAERMARDYAAQLLKDGTISSEQYDSLIIESFGVSSEETGNPMDRRAADLLTSRGVDVEGHHARRIGSGDAADLDLIIAAEEFHLERMREFGVPEEKLFLVTDFVEGAAKGEPLPDPWYGDAKGFEDTYAVLNSAIPRIMERVLGMSGLPAAGHGGD